MAKALGAMQRSVLIVLARRPTPLKSSVLLAALKRSLKQAPPVKWTQLFGGLQERGLVQVDGNDNVSITEEGRVTIRLLQMHE